MKNFNNLYELWEYCSNCPLCKSWKRNIDLSMGPDYAVNVKKWSKFGSKLYVNFKIITDNHYFSNLDIQANIDCVDNIFTIDTRLKENCLDNVVDLSQFTEIENFYIYLYSKCLDCCKSSLNTLDIVLDMKSGKITSASIQDETFSLSKYRLELNYENNLLKVRNHKTTIKKPAFRCPIIDLDFSDLEKLEAKIKTLLIFS